MKTALMVCCVMVSLVLQISNLGAEEKMHSLFNGKNLKGWRGQPMFDPADWEKTPAGVKAEAQRSFNEEIAHHWSVKDGEIVSDGIGSYLTTDKDYGNFEMTVDWKIVGKYADSGIYLRGYPQVQIWDPESPKEQKNGCAKGSGSLWNNHDEKNGKFPLVKADNPPGEWNTFKIKMVGDRVTVHFNDQLTVENASLDNYFGKDKPIVARGPIQLQTHGGEIRFRNVQIRELPAEEK